MDKYDREKTAVTLFFDDQFGYTDLNAKNSATGDRLTYVAEQIAKWWNKLYLGNHWRVGAGNAPEVSSEMLYDAMLGYSIKQWDFTLDATKLTDEEFVSWYRSEGKNCGFGAHRNVTANVRYRF